jgi:alkaline phosphatase D
MATAPTRIVQITDTHFSAAAGVPEQWPATLDWLRDDPPALIVHTGDIVCEDPDAEDDRRFARQLLDHLPAPLRCIPGNHDIGFYGDDEPRPRRLSAFHHAWGDDRFSDDLSGWRVVGVDAYLLSEPDHDAWLHAATRTALPVLIFIHQPLTGDPPDGWEMPTAARDAFRAAVDGADVRVIASGHRHAAGRLGRAVWAPSLTLTGDGPSGFDPRPGLVEHTVGPGYHDWRIVRPWNRASVSSRGGRSA